MCETISLPSTDGSLSTHFLTPPLLSRILVSLSQHPAQHSMTSLIPNTVAWKPAQAGAPNLASSAESALNRI
jgi:hypothetical protein